MASSREYMEYVTEQLAAAEGISFRPMMGEYLLICQGKTVGGIYDDRLLVKPTERARRLMPDAPEEMPYPGAKPMLLADNLDDREALRELVYAVAGDLPAPKKRRGTERG